MSKGGAKAKHQFEDSGRNVINPPKFYGETGEDVEKWLKAFERSARANGERAADFWDELPEEVQNDLGLLKEALQNHFLPKEARRLFYSDLFTRKQGEEESANDFGRDIQHLVRKAYADMPARHQDTLMREHFVNGLRPSLRRLVLIADPKRFEDALSTARREEIHDQVVSGAAPWVKPDKKETIVSPVPVASVQSAETDMTKRIDRLEAMMEKLMSANIEQRQTRTRSQMSRDLRCTDGRPICAKSVTGEELLILGSTTVTLDLGDSCWMVECYVVSNFKYSCLLGTDFLTKSSATIDLGNLQACIGQTRIPISVVRKPQQVQVNLVESLEIPARSEAILKGSIEGLQGTVLLEPKYELFCKNESVVYPARSIAPVENGTIPVKLVNTNNFPVKVFSDTCVGMAEIVDGKINGGQKVDQNPDSRISLGHVPQDGRRRTTVHETTVRTPCIPSRDA
eukprot:gene1917-16424_t